MGDPHQGGKQDDPAAKNQEKREKEIHRLKEELKKGKDPKTGKPLTRKQIQKIRNRLKLLEGRHHRIPGHKGTKGGKPKPKPKPKPIKLPVPKLPLTTNGSLG